MINSKASSWEIVVAMPMASTPQVTTTTDSETGN
jgi:hypothetical protein